jgi:thiol-disulfide isomerase/thioredoxin
MKKNRRHGIARLIPALLFTLALSAPACADSDARGPGLRFADLNGGTVRLSDHRGKRVLVNFWAPWWPLCWPEIPALNELDSRSDVVVIGVAMDYGPDEQSVRDAIVRQGMRFHAQVLGGSRRAPDGEFRKVGRWTSTPPPNLYAPNGTRVLRIPGQINSKQVLDFMMSQGSKQLVQQTGRHGGEDTARAVFCRVTLAALGRLSPPKIGRESFRRRSATGFPLQNKVLTCPPQNVLGQGDGTGAARRESETSDLSPPD